MSWPSLGGPAPDAARRPAQLREHAEGAQAAAQGLVRVADEVPAREEVRVLHALLHAVYAGAGHLGPAHDLLYLLRVVQGEPAAYLRIQLAPRLRVQRLRRGRGRIIGKARLVKAQGAHEAGVHRPAHGSEADIPAVPALEHVPGLGGGGPAAAAADVAQAQGALSEGLAHYLGLRLVLGDVHDLALARLPGVHIGRQQAEEREKRRDVVAHGRGHDERRPVGPAVEEGVARKGLAYHVVGGLVADLGHAPELAMSVAGDVDDDEGRVRLEELRVADAELFGPDHVLDEDVAPAYELQEQLVRIGAPGPQLQGHRQAVARLLSPGRAYGLPVPAPGQRAEAAVGVAHAGPLYLYDLRAELGQHAGGEGHRDERARAHHAHALKRPEARRYEFPFRHLSLRAKEPRSGKYSIRPADSAVTAHRAHLKE